MGHAHGTDARRTDPVRHRRTLAGIAAVLALATLVGLVALWPEHEVSVDVSRVGLVEDVYGAEVVGVRSEPCGGVDVSGLDLVRCTRVRFRLHQGPDEGDVRTLDLPVSASSPTLEVGDEIVLAYLPDADPGYEYLYTDRQRRPVLLVLAILFALAVALLGRSRGIAALVGLAISIVLLLQFLLPAILQGESPELVAIVGAAAIAFVVLYLTGGFTTRTTIAVLGTLAALGLTVALAAIFTAAAHFTGLATEEALLVRIADEGLDLQGLVLAGMVLGALGALDDITVTQASAIWEISAANPTMSARDLYRAGVRVGRDHVGSAVNTLALAYAGASLPLLILFVLSRQSLGTIANSEVVAVPIVATLVGSIGLVAAVPVTTWLAAYLLGGSTAEPRHGPEVPGLVAGSVPTGVAARGPEPMSSDRHDRSPAGSEDSFAPDSWSD